jgi:hypothetical protein
MRHTAHSLSLAIATALLVLASAANPAAAATRHAYGALRFAPGQLRSLDELPPGQLKRQLQALSPRAQANALAWLQKISLSGSDLDTLRVDLGGGLFFVDDQPVPTAVSGPSTGAPGAGSAGGGSAPATFAPSDAFSLHSKPGAANRVYLDFNGHSFSNTAWGAGTFNAIAFSTDADRTTFSDSERAIIVEIWHRVAEDYAPFDIDVTTEQPASFDSRTGRVVITEDQQADGTPMPSQGAGGVAYVNVFGASNYATYYSPALVYADNLGPNGATYIAEASAHEFGHNLGLSHDGTTGGTTYYAGQGSGYVSWAPIMGNGYYNNVTEFSKGEYPGANQTQDDLAIIAGKLAYRPDDHGNSLASGTPLQVAADGSVDSSNPELDPYNLLPQNKGIINNGADVDVFTFTAGAGPLTLAVTPAWDAFYRTARRGANLDVSLELRDGAGNLVAANEPNTDTNASISATVAAGTYQLVIGGVGNAVTAYSDYDSLGEYFINGSITVGGGADTSAPNPDPMSFASAPAATSASAIAMTATSASDPSGGVQYRFSCVAGGAGCVASAWQSAPGYSATGLSASTSYSYTVQARDALGNTTAASAVASATTQAAPPPPSNFTLTARGYKVKGQAKVDLAWSNQPVGNVDVYRNGVLIQSNRTGTSYTDAINAKGAGSYTHKVCSAGTSTCSNTTTTAF